MSSLLGLASSLGGVDTLEVLGEDKAIKHQQRRKHSNRKNRDENVYVNFNCYTHLIAVDFEATCWEQQKDRPYEIIEFPAILYNLKTNNIEEEFHYYITPSENRILSKFCTTLTGIQQEQINNGISLQESLIKFNEWLKAVIKKYKLVLPKTFENNLYGNVCFTTWSDWDFGKCLIKECSRKKIRKPPYFNQWIDLRVVYSQFYKYRPASFSDALDHAHLPLVGHLHSGIDDSKNLATLAGKMYNDGVILRLTTDLNSNNLLNRKF